MTWLINWRLAKKVNYSWALDTFDTKWKERKNGWHGQQLIITRGMGWYENRSARDIHGGKGDSNLSLTAVLALIDRVLIDLTLAVEDVPLLGFTGKKIIYSSFWLLSYGGRCIKGERRGGVSPRQVPRLTWKASGSGKLTSCLPLSVSLYIPFLSHLVKCLGYIFIEPKFDHCLALSLRK